MKFSKSDLTVVCGICYSRVRKSPQTWLKQHSSLLPCLSVNVTQSTWPSASSNYVKTLRANGRNHPRIPLMEEQMKKTGSTQHSEILFCHKNEIVAFVGTEMEVEENNSEVEQIPHFMSHMQILVCVGEVGGSMHAIKEERSWEGREKERNKAVMTCLIWKQAEIEEQQEARKDKESGREEGWVETILHTCMKIL